MQRMSGANQVQIGDYYNHLRGVVADTAFYSEADRDEIDNEIDEDDDEDDEGGPFDTSAHHLHDNYEDEDEGSEEDHD